MWPSKCEHKGANWIGFSEHFTEQTNFRIYLEVLLRDGSDNFSILKNDTDLIRFQCHFCLPRNIGIVHVLGDYSWVCSPSKMHNLISLLVHQCTCFSRGTCCECGSIFDANLKFLTSGRLHRVPVNRWQVRSPYASFQQGIGGLHYHA